MLIPLSQLKSNPERDFRVDSLNEAVIEALSASITEDGFWGGVTARPGQDGGYEIAAGHHRIEAARRAGLTEAEIFIGDFDDETMVRIYARENATQRGHQVTAIDGSVLASVRLLVKQLLSDAATSHGTVRGSIFESERAFDTAKGQLLTDRGIGQNLIGRILRDMPGMTMHSIGDSLARLKASGDYARNIRAIAGTIDTEDSAKAVKVVSEQEVTFDLAGVAPYLRLPAQISAFKKLSDKFDDYLPFEGPAPLAKEHRWLLFFEMIHFLSGYLLPRESRISCLGSLSSGA